MDSITIQGLKIETTIGVHDWEQKIKQTVILDLTLECDIRAAARSEQLSDTFDYFAISEAITEFVKQHPFKLIESLAEQISELLLTQFSVTALQLTVCKPHAINNAQNIAISIQRHR